MSDVYLAFGSNIGDRLSYIVKSICLLAEREIELLSLSSIYETEPYGYTEQEPFLNCVGLFDFSGTPEELLKRTMSVEKLLGRKREMRWGPRTIDIDILLFDKIVYEDENLKIPHYDMENRIFVIKPLLEIVPYLTNPETGQPYAELLEKLEKTADANRIMSGNDLFHKVKAFCG